MSRYLADFAYSVVLNTPAVKCLTRIFWMP